MKKQRQSVKIKNNYLYLGIALMVLFVGCSSKKYFAPTHIDGKIKFENKLSSNIDTTNRYGAVLDDGKVITKNGSTYLKINKNSSFLNETKNYYIIAQDCHKVELIDKNTQVSTIFPTDACAVSANTHEGQLALILSDNSTQIYDIKTQKSLFNQKGTPTIAVDSLIAAPVFLKEDNILIFPTLDGRLLIVDNKNFKVIRNVVLNSEKFFNNVMYLVVDGDNMFAATDKKLVAVIAGKEFSYDSDIRDILYHNNHIYILSLEGEIIELDKTLRQTNKVKLPFANFSAIVIIGDKLYTLEKRGYLIEVDLSNFTYKTFEIKGFFVFKI